MARPGWYMFCYDIADPKRLAKVHRMMKKNGVAAQKSLFFVQGTELQMKVLLEDLGKLIRPKYDDIRAYPVSRPDKVWSTGGVLETYPLIFFDETKKNNSNHVTRLQPDNSVKASFWRRLWKK